MEVAYYGQFCSDLQLVLTNSIINLVYCACILLSKLTFLKVVFVHVLPENAILVPGLNNPLSAIHPTLLLLAYLRGFKKLHPIPLSVFLMWFSLFLGGWWASQEFNWGGWWNWDLIESPALLFSLLMLTLFHRSNSTYIFKVCGKFVRSLLLFLLLVNARFLSNNSVHSFINTPLLFEKYVPLTTLDPAACTLVLVSFLNLSNLLLLKFLFVYAAVCITAVTIKGALKISKCHKIAVMLTITHQFGYKLPTAVCQEFWKPSQLTYNLLSYTTQHTSQISVTISWYKEISSKF